MVFGGCGVRLQYCYWWCVSVSVLSFFEVRFSALDLKMFPFFALDRMVFVDDVGGSVTSWMGRRACPFVMHHAGMADQWPAKAKSSHYLENRDVDFLLAFC